MRGRFMEHGLMVYPMGGTIGGRRGDHVLLAPPFIVTEDDVAEIVDRLARAVAGAIADAYGGRSGPPSSGVSP